MAICTNSSFLNFISGLLIIAKNNQPD